MNDRIPLGGWRKGDKVTPGESLDQHTVDDVDSSDRAHHHTLGTGSHQAAPGRYFSTLKAGIDTGIVQTFTDAAGQFTVLHALKATPVFIACEDATGAGGQFLAFRAVSWDDKQVVFKVWDIQTNTLYVSSPFFYVSIVVMA